jgi:hypothetical protein
MIEPSVFRIQDEWVYSAEFAEREKKAWQAVGYEWLEQK